MELLLKYFPALSPLQKEQFQQLQSLYTHWNAQINVISRKDIEQLYERHVLHALAIARFTSFNPGSRLLDIGTGGGFPAIPLAIFFPDVQLTACDSIAKKIKVVQEIAAALELKNIEAQSSRVEKLQGSYDFIVSRAVAPLEELYQWTRHLLARQQRNEKNNGWLCLKGGELQDEIKKLQQINRALQVEEYDLSGYFEEAFFDTKKLLYVYTK